MDGALSIAAEMIVTVERTGKDDNWSQVRGDGHQGRGPLRDRLSTASRRPLSPVREAVRDHARKRTRDPSRSNSAGWLRVRPWIWNGVTGEPSRLRYRPRSLTAPANSVVVIHARPVALKMTAISSCSVKRPGAGRWSLSRTRASGAGVRWRNADCGGRPR